MRRSAYKKRGGGFTVPRGRYAVVVGDLATPRRGYLLMTGQLLVHVPDDVHRVEARFVRVYRSGKRDGTGDIDVLVTPGEPFQWTWSHPIASGPFRVDVELRVPGSGTAELRYAMGKVHY